MYMKLPGLEALKLPSSSGLDVKPLPAAVYAIVHQLLGLDHRSLATQLAYLQAIMQHYPGG